MNRPKFFAVTGIILLSWNLMGIAAFVLQYTADLAELARTDPTTAQAFAAMPAWVWLAYAVAVSAGTLGAILLLARKAAATSLFLISLIAVVIQFGYTFLGTNIIAIKGASVMIFPLAIIAMAIVQYLYARHLVAKGTIR